MEAVYKKYDLIFKRPSGTSRGILKNKETWFLILNNHGKFGIGECGLFRGLSIDDGWSKNPYKITIRLFSRRQNNIKATKHNFI